MIPISKMKIWTYNKGTFGASAEFDQFGLQNTANWRGPYLAETWDSDSSSETPGTQ